MGSIKQIIVLLTQIYGELNRIRLILADKSKVGKEIADFDATHNYYVPFNDSEENREKYHKPNKTRRIK